MSDSLTTVIIPAYNAEETIRSTVQSVLRQTVRDIEVLVVDDGSEDKTAVLVEDIAKRDAGVRLLGRVHAGVSAARNAGMDNANGKYCMFLDADDTLPDNAVSSLLDAIEETKGAACAIGGMELVRMEGDQEFDSRHHVIEQPLFLTRADLGRSMGALLQANYIQSSCAKLYRTDFLRKRGLRFNEGLDSFEDFDFVLRVLAEMSSVRVIPDIVYRYSLRATSSNSRKAKPDMHEQMRAVKRGVDAFCLKTGIGEGVFEEISTHLFINAVNNIYASGRGGNKKWSQVMSLRACPEYSSLVDRAKDFPNRYTELVFRAVRSGRRVELGCLVRARNFVRSRSGQPT
jgi:glycosyltransferase EpsJ